MDHPLTNREDRELEMAEVLIRFSEQTTSLSRPSRYLDEKELEIADVLINFPELAREQEIHRKANSNQSPDNDDYTPTIKSKGKNGARSASDNFTEAERREIHRIQTKKWRENRTPEQKKEDKERRNARERAKRASRTPEKREEDNAKTRAQRQVAWDKKSESEKEEFREKKRKRNKKRNRKARPSE